jgi:cytochrome oxidase Cu insertion factor (SCO1/SenC/PrrC family)
MKNKPSRNYLFIFLLLLIIFLTPLIVAVLLYNKNPLWLHHKTVNKGTLISSSLNLQQIKLISHRSTLRSLHGSWFLFYLAKSTCREDCHKKLHMLRQITLALGKNRYRVKYGLVLAKEKTLTTHSFLNKDSDLLYLTISKMELKNFFLTLKIKHPTDAYYLADPFGKIILYYPHEGSGEDIYQDLSRVLTISTTG